MIVGLSLAIQGPLAIGIALLLNRKLRGRTLIRALIFVPYVLSEVVAGLAFRLLLTPDGPFNGVLTAFGVLVEPFGDTSGHIVRGAEDSTDLT